MCHRLVIIFIALLTVFTGSNVHAHAASTAYLKIEQQEQGLQLQWRIALIDLDTLLKIDANQDNRFTWTEAHARSADVIQLARNHLSLTSSTGNCSLNYQEPQHFIDGSSEYAELNAAIVCPDNNPPTALKYQLFNGVDASHRVLVRVADAPADVLQPGETLSLELAASEDRPHTFLQFVTEGMTHILSGVDHLLFLIALLLPAVVTRQHGRWIARDDRRAALIQVTWIATAFTAAHSITLGLASFGVIRLQAAVIEPLIALTVLLAALNNIWPVVTRRLAVVAFFFGLIHGFGFAEVLAPLNLPRWDLASALLAFNLGVEGGQLIVVVTSFIVLTAAARWRGYSRWVLQTGSAAVGALALVWIVERVFAVKVLGF